MEFSERLKALRAEKGISQSKLAEEIHISRSAVAKWENGLGLPSRESMELLAGYFQVPLEELTEERERDDRLVKQKRVIGRQRKTIAALSGMLAAGLAALAAYACPPFREYVVPFALGILLAALGVFNMRGNIATVHWYNRRKVRPEDQKPYCRWMGLGTLTLGISISLFAVGMTLAQGLWMEYGTAAGIVLGLGCMLYAQFRYNRGIF